MRASAADLGHKATTSYLRRRILTTVRCNPPLKLAAAGGVGGRANSRGYSALMQQMIVLCYHLMQREEVTPSQLVEEMAVLGRSTDGPSLYRDPSPAFATWIAAAGRGRQ